MEKLQMGPIQALNRTSMETQRNCQLTVKRQILVPITLNSLTFSPLLLGSPNSSPLILQRSNFNQPTSKSSSLNQVSDQSCCLCSKPMLKNMSLSVLMLVLAVSFSLPRCFGAQNGVAQRDLWCVAKNNADDQSLQAAIDWACGAGGANCGPIQQGGPCYDPNDIQTTASWAFNDYYLKNGLADDACSFSNTAALTSLNPSHDNCKFPSSLSVKNGGNTGSTTTTTTTIGIGPSVADFSGCSHISSSWLWPLIISGLLMFYL